MTYEDEWQFIGYYKYNILFEIKHVTIQDIQNMKSRESLSRMLLKKNEINNASKFMWSRWVNDNKTRSLNQMPFNPLTKGDTREILH